MKKKIIIFLTTILVISVAYYLLFRAYNLSKIDQRILEVTQKSKRVMKGSCTGELNSVALYLFDEYDENFAIIYIPEKEGYKSYYITQDWQNPIEEKHDLNPDTKHYIIDFINKIKSYHYDAQYNLSNDPIYKIKDYYWEYIGHRIN